MQRLETERERAEGRMKMTERQGRRGRQTGTRRDETRGRGKLNDRHEKGAGEKGEKSE